MGISSPVALNLRVLTEGKIELYIYLIGRNENKYER
jgi:hypothetical protein